MRNECEPIIICHAPNMSAAFGNFSKVYGSKTTGLPWPAACGCAVAWVRSERRIMMIRTTNTPGRSRTYTSRSRRTRNRPDGSDKSTIRGDSEH